MELSHSRASSCSPLYLSTVVGESLLAKSKGKITVRKLILLIYTFLDSDLDRTDTLRRILSEHNAKIGTIYHEKGIKGRSKTTFYTVIPLGRFQCARGRLSLDSVEPNYIAGKNETSAAVSMLTNAVQNGSVQVTQPQPWSNIAPALSSPTAVPEGGIGDTQAATRKIAAAIETGLLENIIPAMDNPGSPLSAIHSAFLEAAALPGKLPALTITSDPDRPRLFPVDECWPGRPGDPQIKHIIRKYMDEGTAYRRPRSHAPVQGDEAFVLYDDLHNALTVPNDRRTGYVINIPLHGLSEAQRKWELPEELYSSKYGIADESSLGNPMANLTPAYSFVDLHIDVGQRVLSAIMDPCVKLWACYPPTTRNLDLFFGMSGQDNKFVRLSKELEHGIHAVTKPGQVMYLPSGWLHAVYTLIGGGLVGVTWISHQDLPVVHNLFKRGITACSLDVNDGLTLAWLLLAAMESSKNEISDESLRIWCQERKNLRLLTNEKRGSELKNVLEDISQLIRGGTKACPNCRTSIRRNHTWK